MYVYVVNVYVYVYPLATYCGPCSNLQRTLQQYPPMTFQRVLEAESQKWFISNIKQYLAIDLAWKPIHVVLPRSWNVCICCESNFCAVCRQLPPDLLCGRKSDLQVFGYRTFSQHPHLQHRHCDLALTSPNTAVGNVTCPDSLLSQA